MFSKKVLLALLSFAAAFSQAFSENLILPRKAAKIANEIILDKDIQKFAKRYNISYEKSKDHLIEYTLLYVGATMYAKEPDDASIEKQLKKEKSYYASMRGRTLGSVSDEEFLEYMHLSGTTLNTYKDEIKKDLWIQNYFIKINTENKYVPFEAKEPDIRSLMAERPELFEEKAAVGLSLIFFSFYDADGTLRNKKRIEMLRRKSDDCLNRLIRGESFEDLVSVYSDDLKSINSQPKGRYGTIVLDEPESSSIFGQEVLDEFQRSETGLIKKIFELPSGLYIYKIDEKIAPKKLTPDEARLKAISYLEKQYKDTINERIKAELLENLRNRLTVEIY